MFYFIVFQEELELFDLGYSRNALLVESLNSWSYLKNFLSLCLLLLLSQNVVIECKIWFLNASFNSHHILLQVLIGRPLLFSGYTQTTVCQLTEFLTNLWTSYLHMFTSCSMHDPHIQFLVIKTWQYSFCSQAAPEYRRNLDPYWKGTGPLMCRYFHPDGSQTSGPGDKVWGGHECCYSVVTTIVGDRKIREHYVRINRWPWIFVSRNQDWSWEMSNCHYCYSSIPDAYKKGGTGP